MNNRRVVLYIAMSADGYIAREDDNLDWLSMVERPGEDYGYNEFVAGVDTVIMGRRTYDKVLSFGVAFPHKGRQCYVWTKSRAGNDENVTFWNSEISELIATLKKEPGKDIFIDGGAELVHALMKGNLIDRYVISVIPCFIGGGIRLFREGVADIGLKLINCASYSSGLVQLCYEPEKK